MCGWIVEEELEAEGREEGRKEGRRAGLKEGSYCYCCMKRLFFLCVCVSSFLPFPPRFGAVSIMLGRVIVKRHEAHKLLHSGDGGGGDRGLCIVCLCVCVSCGGVDAKSYVRKKETM